VLKYPSDFLEISFFKVLTLGLRMPDGRYFTANLAEAGKRPVFSKSVPKAGILKISNLL